MHKKPSSDRPILSRWLVWLLFLLLGYIIVTGNLHRMRDPESVPAAGTGTSHGTAQNDYPAIRRALDIHSWQRAFDPTLEKGLTIRDFTQGKGRPAGCGDEVSLQLRGRTSKGEPFDPAHKEEDPLTFLIGESTTYPAVEQAVVGMRKGGERTAEAPAALVYGKDKAARDLMGIELRMTLIDLTPELPESAAPLLVSGLDEGRDGARCGDEIAVTLRIWGPGDEKPSKLTRDRLHLGARQLAIGLDYVLPGLRKGETRTVLLPAAYQLHEGNDSPFDGKAMRLVEVTRD